MYANKLAIAGVAMAAVAGGQAFAEGHTEQCFDKGTLTYFDCPTGPTEQAFDGFYIGAFAGGTFGMGSDVLDVDGYNSGGDIIGSPDDDLGVMAGGVAGVMLRFGDIVVGAEGEIGGMWHDDEDQFADFVGDPTRVGDSIASLETDFFASVTATAGFVIAEDTLLYAKGGWAGLQTEVSYVDPNPTGATLDSGTEQDEFLNGYTIGGGLGFALDSTAVVRLEYNFYSFDDTSLTHVADSGGTPFQFDHEVDDEVHAVKVLLTFDLD